MIAVFVLAGPLAGPAAAQSRIKDIVEFEGVREDLPVGYGLVAGLNGTSDKHTSSVFTNKSLIGMLERLGVNARESGLKTNNLAIVMTTATLPPFTNQLVQFSNAELPIQQNKNLESLISRQETDIMVDAASYIGK